MNDIKLAQVLQRELKGQNLTKLSIDLGIPKTLLIEWKNSRLPSGKSLAHLKTLAKHLGLSMDELLFDSPDDGKTLISSTSFVDLETKKQYRISIERIKNKV